MKIFTSVLLALCVAIAVATDKPNTSKPKRYAPLLPNGIESKLDYTSVPQNLEYSNLQRLYNANPSVVPSSLYNYGTPQIYSGLSQIPQYSGVSSVYTGLSNADFGRYGYSGLSGLKYVNQATYPGYSGLADSSLIGSTAYGSGFNVPATVPGSIYGAGFATNYGTPHVTHTPIKDAGTTQNVQVRTITQHVPVAVPKPYPVEVTKSVPVPQPYPVHVAKAVPVPVKVEVPVEVPRPYAVKVAQPVPVQVRVNVPVEVPRPYPVTVTKTVPVPVEKPVYVKYPVKYAVPVPHPYPVEVPQAVPVQVPQPVYVKVPQYKVTKSTAYLQPAVSTYSNVYPAHYPSVFKTGFQSNVYPASYSAGLKSTSYPAPYVSGVKSSTVYPVSYGIASRSSFENPEDYSAGVQSDVYPATGVYSTSNAYSYKGVYPYAQNYKSYGQYLSNQPLNDDGLLKSYIPSNIGGYNGLNSYSTEQLVNKY